MDEAITTIFLIGMDVVLAVMLILILRMAGAPRKVLIATTFVFALWISALGALISTGSMFPSDLSGMALFAVLLVGVGAVTTLMFVTPVSKYLRSMPFELLLIPQGLRVFFGAGFLIEGVLGLMPAAFAIADGITHISAAFLALMAAFVYGKGYDYRFGGWFANIFGMLDIVMVAAGISFYLLPEIGPHHNVMYAAFFAAPIFIGLHVVSVFRLLTAPSLGARDMATFPATIHPVA